MLYDVESTFKVEFISSREWIQREESWLVSSVESADAVPSSCTQIRAISQSSSQHWLHILYQCSSSNMVWLPYCLSASESSFSMPEKLCMFV